MRGRALSIGFLLACGGACASRENTTARDVLTATDVVTASQPVTSATAPTGARPGANAASDSDAREAQWAALTRSPQEELRSERRDPREAELAAAAGCGAEDAALGRVAREIVAARARGLGSPDAETLIAKLRAVGEPHVRPKLVVASGHAPLDLAALPSELAPPARARGGSRGALRCGVALAPTPHGGEVLVAIRVEALADLSPLPTRARTGEWLTFEARIHVSARAAKLVVLGPHGLPRTVPTSLDPATGLARARFALDQPGAFTVQLVGELGEGPRPLLEARVFADVPPTAPGDEPAAPGEDAPGGPDEATALARMIGALRAFEGVPPLAVDDKLAALARAHAERMREGRAVAHDLGDGDPRERFLAEGSLDARAVGENVAHAATLPLAHRALHASPSHRMNLLRADYTHIGVGVAHAADGSVYVCETFASVRPR